MKLIEVKNILNATVFTNHSDDYLANVEVNQACGADLMSDVLAYVKDKGLLLTGLMNLQVIRTAEMMDINSICFVRGKKPSQDLIDLANDTNLVLLGTENPLYVSCGKLYNNGLIC
ncbi:MAG: hypothetical protein IJF30_04070 [Clostridia bacterium]|nr:hypothetical protein [Clostridia bacterium]